VSPVSENDYALRFCLRQERLGASIQTYSIIDSEQRDLFGIFGTAEKKINSSKFLAGKKTWNLELFLDESEEVLRMHWSWVVNMCVDFANIEEVSVGIDLCDANFLVLVQKQVHLELSLQKNLPFEVLTLKPMLHLFHKRHDFQRALPCVSMQMNWLALSWWPDEECCWRWIWNMASKNNLCSKQRGFITKRLHYLHCAAKIAIKFGTIYRCSMR
jgi:hypothetical protein